MTNRTKKTYLFVCKATIITIAITALFAAFNLITLGVISTSILFIESIYLITKI